jgi:hypothetical protein
VIADRLEFIFTKICRDIIIVPLCKGLIISICTFIYSRTLKIVQLKLQLSYKIEFVTHKLHTCITGRLNNTKSFFFFYLNLNLFYHVTDLCKLYFIQ